MLARLPRASMGHAVLLTPSISLRPVFPHFLFPNSFPCHRSENSPVSPTIATLPKTGVSNPCVCHTSETPRGVHLGTRPSALRLRRYSGVRYSARSARWLSSEQILEVAHLLPQHVQLPRQALNFGLRTAVDSVVQFTTHAIFHVLPVLAHHDDRSLNRSEQRQKQVQQDKRIRIPGRLVQAYIDGCVDA